MVSASLDNADATGGSIQRETLLGGANCGEVTVRLRFAQGFTTRGSRRGGKMDLTSLTAYDVTHPYHGPSHDRRGIPSPSGAVAPAEWQA